MKERKPLASFQDLVTTAAVLSILSLGIEVTTRICRSVFLDPLPDIASVLAYSLIPLTLCIARASIHCGDLTLSGAALDSRGLSDLLDLRRAPARLHWLRVLMPAALTVALIYTLLFIPLLPVGLMSICFGVGACVFGPLLNLAVLVRVGLTLRSLFTARRCSGLSPRSDRLTWMLSGALLLQVVLSLVVQPAALGWLLGRAEARDSARGWIFEPLRRLGAPEVLSRIALRQGNPYPVTAWFWSPVATEPGGQFPLSFPRVEYHTSTNFGRRYFELTGRSPEEADLADHLRDSSDKWWEIAREEVAGTVEGLSLAESHIVGAVRPLNETAYQEWTMVFRNNASTPSEARFQVLLPDGGFISKASLWINGRESPAAFGGKGKTREAYETIVRDSMMDSFPRDPLLITTTSPDRALIQCFPVPANGEMKILFGCTSPLRWGGAGGPTLNLSAPMVVERNFVWGPELRHTYRYVGSWPETFRLDPTHGWRVAVDDPAPNGAVRHVLSGESRPQSTPSTRQIRWLAPRSPGLTTPVRGAVRLWDPAHLSQGKGIDFMVVVDTSESIFPKLTGDDARRLAAALAACPDSRLRCLLLRDWNGAAPPGPSWSEPWVSTVQAESILSRAFQHRDPGAFVPTGALSRALDLAGQNRRRTAVLWLHGSCPDRLFDLTRLEATLRLAPQRVTFTGLACRTGANEVMRRLSVTGRAKDLQRTMLADPFGELVQSAADPMGPEEKQSAPAGFTPLGGSEPAISGLYLPTSLEHQKDDWGRLTAGSRILAAWKRGVTEELSDSKKWIRLGVEQRLVTPLTGAVVLETKKDYEKYNLSNKVASTDLPSVPEPGTLGLLALAGGAHWIARRRAARKKPPVAA